LRGGLIAIAFFVAELNQLLDATAAAQRLSHDVTALLGTFKFAKMRMLPK
jgi:hypothetical protein